MKELNNIQEKLHQLLTRFYELQEKNAQQEKIISGQEKKLKALEAGNKKLQEENEKTHLNTYLDQLSETRKIQIKNQIDLVLKMIEKNRELLK